MIVTGRQFTAEKLQLNTNKLISVEWVDKFGLSARKPFDFELSTREDQVPFVDAEGSSRTLAILDDEVISLELSASDDYGLKDLGITLTWAPVGA